MRLTNSATQYGSVARFFHWTIFLLLVNQFVVGAVMSWLDEDKSLAGIPQPAMVAWHRSVGLLILMLVILRLGWRQATALPSWPADMKRWEQQTLQFVERGLYTALLIMPAAGLLFSVAEGDSVPFFGLFRFPGSSKPNADLYATGWLIHFATSYAIMGLVFVHVFLVFRHHSAEKDRFLNRMLPFTKV